MLTSTLHLYKLDIQIPSRIAGAVLFVEWICIDNLPLFMQLIAFFDQVGKELIAGNFEDVHCNQSLCVKFAYKILPLFPIGLLHIVFEFQQARKELRTNPIEEMQGLSKFLLASRTFII